MAATLLAAAAACVTVLFIGQATLRICGAPRWSWMAPTVGLSVVMLATVGVIHIPGRCTTAAILGAILTVAAAIWCMASPDHRPPLSGLLAALPVALLLPIPFIAAGHPGILGTGLDNDMASHLLWAETYLSRAVTAVTPLPTEYPLGPHSMVAVISSGTGIPVADAFTGWSMALPIVNAWTALALVRRSSWLGKAATATVVGLPFLVAAYYGEGSFKEVLMAGLMLGVAAFLADFRGLPLRRRWIPVALLMGGAISAYTVLGLLWPLLAVGIWSAIAAWQRLRRGGLPSLRAAARRNLGPAGLALGVLAVALLPQSARIARLISHGESSFGLRTGGLGNLLGELPGWEGFGVWPNADFRLPSPPFFPAGLWIGAVVALAALGALWAVRKQRWALVSAGLGSFAIWVYSATSRSPYQSAKALVIASPLLLAFAVLPLIESRSARTSRVSLLALLLAVGLTVGVGVSDVGALRFSPVGPTDHMTELRSLRTKIAVRRTLFLGDDDFFRWELAGVPVSAAIIGDVATKKLRPEKSWAPGQPLDLDSVDAEVLNRFHWVITVRDSAGSSPPHGLRLIETTQDYALWERIGKVEERSILREGPFAGAILRCDSPAGRRVLSGGGVAGTRSRPIETTAPTTQAGSTGFAELSLPAGSWRLTLQYRSLVPVEASVGGLRRTLPPSLDRLGPRWPLGRINVARDGRVKAAFKVDEPPLTASTTFAELGRLTATRVGGNRIVPIRQACGRYVDWYRSAPGR